MALTANVPSDRFEDLQRDVQDATRFPNATSPYPNRVGETITPLPLLQEQINASIQSTGWFAAAGSFEAGGTITARNQYLQLVTTAGSDVAGGYTWGGALPKVVSPGSTPATAGGATADGAGWVYRSDATVAAGLAAGTALFPNGKTSSDIEKNSTASYRAGKVGVFSTSGFLPNSFRGGALSYAKDTSGRARLINDLSHFYPTGGLVDAAPNDHRSVQIEIASASFNVTGLATIFRAVVSGYGTGFMANAFRPRCGVFIKSSGQKFLNAKNYPATDYSCDVYYSTALAGLVVELKLPVSVSPTDVYVEIFYQEQSSVKKIYIDPVAGNDNYDGSTFDWAKKTFTAALTTSPNVIFLKPAVYDLQNWIGTYTTDADLAVRCVGGVAKFVSRTVSFGAYSLDSGTTYVSAVGGSPAVVGAVDLGYLDQSGLPTFLKDVGSLALCRSTPSSSFFDAADGRKLYVNLPDGRVPTSDLVLPLNAAIMFRHSAPGRKLMLENIVTVGGSGGGVSARYSGNLSVLVNKNVSSVGMYNSNGYDIKDVGLCISIGCTLSQNGNDGFNYTAFNGVSPHFIEIDCVSYDQRTDTSSNGSSAHDDCAGFRLNTNCFNNSGPGIADVGSAVTYNVSVSSNNNGPNVNASGIRADGSAVVYVDGGSALGNSGSDFEGTNGGVILVKDIFYGSLGSDVSEF